MPNITPLQSDFSIGEVARDVQLRSTLDARNRGLSTLTNFLTDSHGPAHRRPGFRFLGKVGEVEPSLVLKQIYWTGTGTKIYASEGNHENYEEVWQFPGRDLLWINVNPEGEVAGLVGNQVTATKDISSWPLFDIPADAQVATFDGNFVWSTVIDKWLLIRPNLNQQGVIVFSTTDFVDWVEEFREPTGPLVVHSTADSDGNIFCAANSGATGTGYYSVWTQNPDLTWSLSLTLMSWDPVINSYFAHSEVNDAGDAWVVGGGRQQKWSAPSHAGVFVLRARSTISTDDVEFFKWGEDKFVLTQDRDPWMMYSFDGITWNACTNNGDPWTDIGTVSGHSISFHPTERWVAVRGVHQWVSDDGITWERGPADGLLNSFAWGVLDYMGPP